MVTVQNQMLHPDCQGHVSACFGATYCGKTGVLYINASMVLTGKLSINPVDSEGFEAFTVVSKRFMRIHKRVRLSGIVLLSNDSEMPGIRMNGLDPDEPGSFSQKGVK